MPVGCVAPLFRMARSSAAKELYDVRSARTLQRIDRARPSSGRTTGTKATGRGVLRVRMVP
jgi:hypothetical protein